ncbi:MAG: lipopolysaccharide transport periplasmic protein LptA [Pseudomonadota bacterium]
MSEPIPRGQQPALRRVFSQLALGGLLLVSGFWVPSLVQALPGDRDQPIRITADTAIRDEKQGFTVYTGNVHMIQGSLDIVADELTIYHETQEADKIVAIGNPARMKQRPQINEPMVRARAQVIEYFKIEDRVHLKDNAYITRDDGSSVTGDSIDYYITEELVKADSERSPDGRRVEVVIPPNVVRENDESAVQIPQVSEAAQAESTQLPVAESEADSAQADNTEQAADPNNVATESN